LTNIVTQIAKRERFKFMKNTGDGFLITFSKVSNSVHFALDVLKAVNRQSVKADETRRINLRFGVNLGETRIDKKGDRLGGAVNMTFRVEGVKPEALIPIEDGMEKGDMPLDNRIFMTENADKEIKDMEGVKTRLVGLFELKGITGLHKIYQLTSID
jgi:class 3 adenylate cyclase